MANFTPSKYQSAVYNFVTYDNCNAVIDAVAGSGKSTTIVNAVELIPSDKQVLFLAFNKAIVEELKIKLAKHTNVTVMTLHQLGFAGLRKSFRGINLNNDKYFRYVNNSIKYGGIKPTIQLEDEEVGEFRYNVLKLVDLSRVYLCENTAMLFDIALKYDINVLDNEIEIALQVVNWGKNEVSEIDFTDMIYLPNVKKISMETYDYVFIDECQDLNTCQRELFLKCVKPVTGRFIAVGDPRQAIYGFAGADVESFNILKNLPNTISLPLSVCYRSATSIIELAKTIVPQIEANEGAVEGAVIRDSKLIDIQDGDMVLCRVTSPLVALCMHYIGKGVKAYVKGKDIGTNLINMIKKTKKRNMNEVLERLNIELDKIANKIVKRTQCTIAEARENSMYNTYLDKINAIQTIANDLKTSDAVCNRIDAIFKDNERAGICLSTIHKSKGLESDNVYIICEHKMLLKRAMKVEWTATQEYNLVYVAYTRAKKKLGFIVDFMNE